MTIGNQDNRDGQSTSPDTIPGGRLSRDTATQLLHEEIKKYIDDHYDGSQDKRGMKMELRQLGDDIGHTVRWFVQQMEADLDDVRILMMLAWVDCTQEDFDHFYDVIEEDRK